MFSQHQQLIEVSVPLQEFMKKLEEKRSELSKATSKGDALLALCHPDSITTIKHWITIIQARFEEVGVPSLISGSSGCESSQGNGEFQQPRGVSPGQESALL